MTATDDDDVEGDEILALNGTAAGDLPAGSVMLTITDNDMITYTLSGPADMNIAEGKSAVLTATASSAVQADRHRPAIAHHRVGLG